MNGIHSNTHPREWFWPRANQMFTCRYCGRECKAHARNQQVCPAPECQYRQHDEARARAIRRQKAKREREKRTV